MDYVRSRGIRIKPSGVLGNRGHSQIIFLVDFVATKRMRNLKIDRKSGNRISAGSVKCHSEN
jgi:hypothetical protein